MKRSVLVGLTAIGLLFLSKSYAQEETPLRDQLENQAATDAGVTEDDGLLLELESFLRNPVSLNRAGADELHALGLLNEMQINQLLRYRSLLGDIMDLHELQAIPGWDLETIRKLIPYVTVKDRRADPGAPGNRFRDGRHQLLLRVARPFGSEKSVVDQRYIGSPVRLLFRYRYELRNRMQFGWLGDKDGGESFFRGAQRAGFDFYSFHLFMRKRGIIESMALGDYTINMGQGLIHWQNLAFGKSGDPLSVKRQSPVLAPYRSSGEFYFHRGVAATLRTGKWEGTFFMSVRRLSGHPDRDSVSDEAYFSSISSSGYHRTMAELEGRNKLGQTTIGGVLKYTKGNFHFSGNGVFYRFSRPVYRKEEPYNRYNWSGDHWMNASLDYAYTGPNFHFFGETATDPFFHKAILNGLLISVDPGVDISLLYRKIPAAYQSVSGNAFTENNQPANEEGMYTGIKFSLGKGWYAGAFADFFRFPWLKYRVDAPGSGSDWLLYLSCKPDKSTEISARFRWEDKPLNLSSSWETIDYPENQRRLQARIHFGFRVNTAFALRSRGEMVWLHKPVGPNEQGSLFFTDIIYKPKMKPFSGIIRLLFFETDSYDSRVYAFENDVLYSFSIPAFSGLGTRVVINLSLKVAKRIGFWARWAQSWQKGVGIRAEGKVQINMDL